METTNRQHTNKHIHNKKMHGRCWFNVGPKPTSLDLVQHKTSFELVHRTCRQCGQCIWRCRFNVAPALNQPWYKRPQHANTFIIKCHRWCTGKCWFIVRPKLNQHWEQNTDTFIVFIVRLCTILVYVGLSSKWWSNNNLCPVTLCGSIFRKLELLTQLQGSNDEKIYFYGK